MSSPKRLFALAVLPAVLLAGCGDDSTKQASSSTSSPASSASSASSKPSSSSSTLAAPVTKSSLSDVKVDTKNPGKPTVSIPKDKLPFGTKNADPKVLTEGKGKTVTATSYVSADFVMVNGTTGKTIGSTFGERVPAFNMADESNLPGILSALKGKKEGTKFVISLPPSQGFGTAGSRQLGLGATDNLVLYMQINTVEPAQKDCTASPNDPSLPKVSVPAGKAPLAKLTYPKGKAAPKQLTCAVLKEGTGATVKSGQTISAVYTGQIWNGKVFDATAKHGDGKPSQFLIGKGQVVPGWDRTIVGQKVGSRLLLVVPSEAGYGAPGNPQAGIKGTDTLVFVVDITAAK